ncbi:hypothetical protein KHP62_06855 [Rhodobacteraceae bacterium NNCM2]|nr:hypothetical protein [Coraliihabitans acroporae]
MAKFRAIVCDAETGGEGQYDFEASGLLISASPMRVARAFFESEAAQKQILHHFPEYEIYSAFRHEDVWVVTLTGTLISADNRKVPFMCMISMTEPD